MGQQYLQRYDESVYVAEPVLVPGLRGRARSIVHYPDPLTEPPLGPIREVNGGYNFTYVSPRTRSYTPATSVYNTFINGKFQPKLSYNFKARQIQELSVHKCT